MTTIPSDGGYMHEIARTLVSVLNAHKTLLSKQLIKRKHYRGSVNYAKTVHDSY